MLRRTSLMLAAAALVVAPAAWVAASDSIHVTLTEPTSIDGKVIPAGDVHLSWQQGPKDTVNVKVEENGKVVTTAQARLEPRETASPEQELVLRTPKAGKQILEEVRMRGETEALVFGKS
jgi:hypothetical protein